MYQTSHCQQYKFCCISAVAQVPLHKHCLQQRQKHSNNNGTTNMALLLLSVQAHTAELDFLFSILVDSNSPQNCASGTCQFWILVRCIILGVDFISSFFGDSLFSNVYSIFTQQLTRVSHVQPRARTDVGNQTNSIELKNIYVRLKLLLIEKLHRC